MARPWSPRDFDSAYDRFVSQEEMQFGTRDYYERYRSRYRACIQRFCSLSPVEPIKVLDVGGGQLALLCNKLWNDHAYVADLPGPHVEYMKSHGVEAINWNLCKSDAPCAAIFDVIFFSEVIEHLPIPGHVVLQRLRRLLRPGGVIICTTPNLYRLRNVVFMALGLPIYDHFEIPDDDVSLGHVIEYSRDHLRWQFEKAGFTRCHIEYCQMHHSPTNPVFRTLSWVGYPLFVVPRFRDNLVAIAYAPDDNGQIVATNGKVPVPVTEPAN
jgi:2-polyprenyl-3-methyl-5-hydroxy-6-metoxy-1,4-benzoquinol methylase